MSSPDFTPSFNFLLIALTLSKLLVDPEVSDESELSPVGGLSLKLESSDELGLSLKPESVGGLSLRSPDVSEGLLFREVSEGGGVGGT